MALTPVKEGHVQDISCWDSHIPSRAQVHSVLCQLLCSLGKGHQARHLASVAHLQPNNSFTVLDQRGSNASCALIALRTSHPHKSYMQDAIAGHCCTAQPCTRLNLPAGHWLDSTDQQDTQRAGILCVV